MGATTDDETNDFGGLVTGEVGSNSIGDFNLISTDAESDSSSTETSEVCVP